MRSLVVCPYLPDAADHGGRIRTRVFLKALVRLGPVEVGAPFPGEDGRERADRLAAELGVEVFELPDEERSPSPLGKLGSWSRGRSELFERRWSEAARAVVAARLADGPELVAVDSSHSLPLLPAGQTPPLLLHLHNIESALLARRDGVARGLAERVARRVEARLVGRLEAGGAGRAGLCLTTSELDADRLRQLAPAATVESVGNSINLEAAPVLPSREESPPRLLFVGSLDYPPNRDAVEELVEVHLPVLRAACPELEVRLVGQDGDGELTRMARARGVEAVGRVDDLVPHYRESTAVYLPIRGGGGTRIKVLEAFAMGRPVLSTAVGVEGLPVEECVHYLRIERPEDGVAALAAVRGGHAGDVVRAARALVEAEFSDEAAVDRMAALFRRHFPSR